MSIYENNKINRENNHRGKKKKMKVDIKTVAISLVILGTVMAAIPKVSSSLNKTSNAKNYVYETYDKVEIPYHYSIDSTTDYLYSDGNYYELSDGVKYIIKDLTKKGASLEEIYYYMSVHYGTNSQMMNLYKDYLKANGEKLHLSDYKNQLYSDMKDNELNEGRSKK